MTRPAILALADGNVFHGCAIGADGSSAAEVVFNTAMTGYQEILTDPSYARQIVTLTHPHIGNTGCNAADAESDRVHAAGLVIRDLPLLASSWRSEEDLGSYLTRNRVVAITDIDTRRLTRILRESGAQNGCIMAGENATADAALAQARGCASLEGLDLAKVVSIREIQPWTEGSFDLDSNAFTSASTSASSRFRVVAYDFGTKRNILRMLVDRGCDVTLVPAQTSAADVMAMNPDGVFLSNGPGDPAACDYAINATREFLLAKVPLFGICLGHQILGIAAGARSTKMKFGHHGANHPVIDTASGRVMISSQNHGFAIDETSLPANVKATHRSLFDGTLQGIALDDAPAFGFQGHPEASPGPADVACLFDRFIDLIDRHKGGQRRSAVA